MNLDATLLNNLQGVNTFSESRYAELGLVDLAKNSTMAVDWISPDEVQKIAELSSMRSMELPTIVDGEFTVTAAPGFDIPANLSKSDKNTPLAFDIFTGFRHYPALYANNMVKGEFDLNHKMKKACYALGKGLEAIIAARLEARKTQVLPLGTSQVSDGSNTYSFNTSTDTLEISLGAQKEFMFANLNTIMEANEIGGGYDIVTSRAGLSLPRNEWAKYGQNNDKNLQALGFPSLDQLHETGNISPNSNKFNGFYVRNGAFGVYENFPVDFRMGTKVEGREWSISDIELPFVRMRANVHVNRAATKAESLVSAGRDTNLTMTMFEEMALWVRVYFFEEYNSDLTTRPNPVIKLAGLAS